jgi:methylenetetrahydrofolate reductase (NADPH)
VLEKQLRTGKFVVVTEVTPPVSSNPDKLRAELMLVKPYVTAVNFTDGSSAVPRMSSTACCKTAFDQGIEPVLQIAARDTTRTGLQSIAVGVNSLGIKNILCITGDNPRIGPSPVADMDLLDIDSVQMLWILRRMRDEGVYLDGRKMKYPPEFFIGAATSPFASDPELQAIKDQKKVNAGAQFFQTNLIFEPEKLEQWLENLDKRDVLGKVYILIGIAPLKSYKAALYLHEKVPGVYLPENILNRMEKAGENASEEGVQIALEVIDEIKQKRGVSGIHLMTLGWEEIVERIVTESGLTFPGLHGS